MHVMPQVRVNFPMHVFAQHRLGQDVGLRARTAHKAVALGNLGEGARGHIHHYPLWV